jgi:rhamnosyltransferase
MKREKLKSVHVFIIGAKGIPARYGGFETFVERLAEYRRNPALQYHVTGLSDTEADFDFQGTHCHNLAIPVWIPAGPRAVLYNLLALRYACRVIRDQSLRDGFIYQLSSRLGPFVHLFRLFYRSCGFQLLVNPDGLEWKRRKWSLPVRLFWRWCEKSMVQAADGVVCDSRVIQSHIRRTYPDRTHPTTFIAYGAEFPRPGTAQTAGPWLREKGLQKGCYYLVVGRFEPENNFDLMVREYLKARTTFPLVFICNLQNNYYFRRLSKIPGFSGNKNIRWMGPVYDQALLSGIRRSAFAYLHGHEVGGTNPSLLEAMAATPLILALDVEFNRETLADTGLFFDKNQGSLAALLEKAEKLPIWAYGDFARRSLARVHKEYSWGKISVRYEKLFMEKAGWE